MSRCVRCQCPHSPTIPSLQRHIVISSPTFHTPTAYKHPLSSQARTTRLRSKYKCLFPCHKCTWTSNRTLKLVALISINLRLLSHFPLTSSSEGNLLPRWPRRSITQQAWWTSMVYPITRLSSRTTPEPPLQAPKALSPHRKAATVFTIRRMRVAVKISIHPLPIIWCAKRHSDLISLLHRRPGKRRSRLSSASSGSRVRTARTSWRTRAVALHTDRMNSVRRKVWASNIWHQFARIS